MLRNPVSKRSVLSLSLGLLALAALAAMTLSLMPRAAKADGEVPFKGAFTVNAELITTTSACAIGDSNCIKCVSTSGAYYVEAQGIGSTSLGTMFIEVLKCGNPATPDFPFGSYTGAFSMTAPNGKDSLTGNYSGKNDNAGDVYGFGPFSGNLTIMGGTGKFDGAQGIPSFTAESGPATPGPAANVFMAMAFYSVQGNLALHSNN